jgi:hypothetical protein
MGGMQPSPMFGKSYGDRLDLLKSLLRREGTTREKVVHFVVE